MKNLEIKVKVENLDEIKSRLSLATFKETLLQTDKYFLLGKVRLKIREEGTRNEIILYARKMKNETRKSTYYRVILPQKSANFIKAALHFILGTKVIIAKRRDLYVYKNTRIHLDDVVNLGRFIELETVFREEKNTKYLEEHEWVKQALSLHLYPTIPGSYSDLLKT